MNTPATCTASISESPENSLTTRKGEQKKLLRRSRTCSSRRCSFHNLNPSLFWTIFLFNALLYIHFTVFHVLVATFNHTRTVSAYDGCSVSELPRLALSQTKAVVNALLPSQCQISINLCVSVLSCIRDIILTIFQLRSIPYERQ